MTYRTIACQDCGDETPEGRPICSYCQSFAELCQSPQKVNEPVASPRYQDRPARSVVCAANKYGDLVFTGVRHFCPVMLFNMAAYDIPKLRSEFGEVQGFIDQFGVFMDRREAALVAKASGQLARYGDFIPEVLFSEDLY